MPLLEVVANDVIFDVDVLRAPVEFRIAYEANGSLIVAVEGGRCRLVITEICEELAHPENFLRG